MTTGKSGGLLAVCMAALVAAVPVTAHTQSTLDTASVLRQNSEFYAAFRDGDLERMRGVWSETRDIGMTPPGRGFLQGRKLIFDAFGLMMMRPPELYCDLQGEVSFRDGKAIVICEENLGTSSSIRMLNVFAPENETENSDERDWRMIYHGPVPEGWQRT